MNKLNLFYSVVLVGGLCILPIYFHEPNVEKPTSNKQVETTSIKLPATITLSESNEEIALDDYIMGVVAGEMPASFHIEALKAQAVAARTYAVYQTNQLTKPIQTTTAHQVYFPVNNLEAKYQEKIKEAIESTRFQILMYDNKVISAMFHASSNGQTESALNYGGSSIPYLTSVKSPEEKSTVKTFTLIQLNALMVQNFTLEDLKNSQIKRNDTNRVELVEIGGKQWSGREFREKLGLASTDFTISVEGDMVFEVF